MFPLVCYNSPAPLHHENSVNSIFSIFWISRKSPVPPKKEDDKRPHIKKPLNAFMLYMKEMRAKVVAECTLKESAAINQILGRRVSATHRCAYECMFDSPLISFIFVTSGILCQERNKLNTTNWLERRGNSTPSFTLGGQHEITT